MSADQNKLTENGSKVSQEARASARVSDPDMQDRQYCVFRVGTERFCFSMVEVEEILEWPLVACVPLAPTFLMGVFNLRGTIVPVIDIASGEGRRPDLLPRHVVVAGFEPSEGKEPLRLAFAADELVGTFASREPLELGEMPQNMNYCCGLLRHETDRLALALDLKRTAEAFSVRVI